MTETTPASEAQPSTVNGGRIASWVREHDERWVFTLLYVGLAVVLSVAISLFWLVVIVMVHGLLEWVVERTRDGRAAGVLARVVWHLKLDIMLVLFALWLAVYIDLIFGLVGLGAMARGGAQLTARAMTWQRSIRGIMLTLDDVALVARSAVKNKAVSSSEDSPSHPFWGDWVGRWSRGDRVTVALMVIWPLLIVLAPWVTDLQSQDVWLLLMDNLHPWPFVLEQG
jgi:hypothetical protein